MDNFASATIVFHLAAAVLAGALVAGTFAMLPGRFIARTLGY